MIGCGLSSRNPGGRAAVFWRRRYPGQCQVGSAGNHGFVRIENGRFVNDAGAIRFNATNLTGPANFPSHKQADLLAERLARFGINCVRLHYMDADYGNFKEEKQPGIIEHDLKTQRNLDPEQMDRLDYMIAQFKKHGIYMNINLHVARKLEDRDGFPGKDLRPHLDKGVDNFEPRMIDLQKEYAKKLMTHVNPYTGFAYTDDPCVAMVEINNENALFNQYFRGSIDKLPEPYSSELQNQWNKWLLKKYKSTKAVYKAWKEENSTLKGKIEDGSMPTVKNDESIGESVKTDFYKFLYDIEHEYWLGIYDYLKNYLSVKSIISGTQLGYTSPFIQAELDYVDKHSYWCHPSPVNPDWKIRNISMVNSMRTIMDLSSQRIVNMPYTISEYNHPFPNQYGAEGQPMLRAYGRLQGWDGVFEYTYNHRLDFEPTAMTYFFSMISRTDVLAHMPACAAIYLRGDVHEAKSSVVGPVNFEAYFDSLVALKRVVADSDFAGYDSRLSLIHKTALNLSGEPGTEINSDTVISDDQKIFTSDTRELTWNIEKPNAGYWTINTLNTKLFTGFPEGREIKLGDISLDIGQTRLGWATISLVSKNATGFGESGEPADILLTATGLVENKGMVIEQVSEKEIKLTDWGEGPMQAEGIPATLTLPVSAKDVKCYALDSRGDQKLEVPVAKLKKGKFEISLMPEYQTIWYEIIIQ